jgi:hypothetical protein
MSEQKWITITVPVEVMPASSPSGDASGTFESFEGDGDRDARRGLWVRHDGREMRARNVHLVAGMARAWLMEPATDWQERVLNEVLLLPISAERGERERCAAEIVRYGIPAVAFAIDRAWNEGADAERNAAAARATKVKPATDYAKKVAAIEAWATRIEANGGPSNDVQGFADLAEEVEIGAEHVPWLLAQLRAVETALTAAGIPSDGRAPAERVESLVTDVVSALDAIGQHTKGRPLKARIEDLGRMLRIATSQAHDRAGERMHDAHATANARHEVDILKRATRAAAITLGAQVPEDAGPEALAGALRDGVETTQAALRVAKVLREDGAPGESAGGHPAGRGDE